MTSPVDAAEGDSVEAEALPADPLPTDEPASAPPSGEPGGAGAHRGPAAASDGPSAPRAGSEHDRTAFDPESGVHGDEQDLHARTRASAPEIVAAVCPYLASAGGSWRMAVPSRDHRCLGLTPPTPQPADKQRRHCLAPEHVECSIYRAAREARAVALAGGADPARIAMADARRRAVPRTAPILLEPPRLIDQATRFQLDRTPGQLALVALMVVAFVFVALSRLTPAGGSGDSPSASASLIAVLPSVSTRPTPSGPVRASASPAPSGRSSASPAPSFRTTYTVKKGDTLASIATAFKTTAAAIRTLNNLKTSTLHVGQVLKIP